MGWVNREAGNQETEGSIGGETTATEKNEWLDNPFAAFRYTGGPIRSKIPPSSSASSTTYASACAVRHPKLVPPPRTPPPRVNPKRTASPSPPSQRNQKSSAGNSIGGKTTATEKNEWPDDPFAAFGYTGGGASSSDTSDSAAAERHPKLTPPPRTPPPRVNNKRTASHVLYLYDADEEMEEEEPTKKKACTDAYRRLTEKNNWRPPPDCPIRLLQEPHYYDPWRVLVICILLNKTQGKQVERVLDDFFKLCPNAEVAKDVCDQDLIELIRPLGLYNKRTEYIKRFSREYLEREWTHVNQLHGVGDYAADAYAIFCVGEPEKVRPTDHKLVPYWGFLCEMIAQKGKSTI